MRRTRTSSSGTLVCDTSSRIFALQGSPRLQNDIVRGITIAQFTPAESLPAGACFEVEITPRVRDLSGRAASSQTFRFTLVDSPAIEPNKIFDFQSYALLDRHYSGGDWTGGAGAVTSLVGDVRRGEFRISDALRIPDTFYFFET